MGQQSAGEKEAVHSVAAKHTLPSRLSVWVAAWIRAAIEEEGYAGLRLGLGSP